MLITHQERESLIGPGVIGAIFGLLTALAIVAADSEFHGSLKPLYPGVENLLIEAALTFGIVTFGIITIFGLVPIAIRKVASKRRLSPDA